MALKGESLPLRGSALNCQPGQQNALTADGVESFLCRDEIPVLPVVNKDEEVVLQVEEEKPTISSAEHPSSFSSPTASRFADDPLPPLPEIRSEEIRKRIFNHSSGLPGYHEHVFQVTEDDPPVDNEG